MGWRRDRMGGMGQTSVDGDCHRLPVCPHRPTVFSGSLDSRGLSPLFTRLLHVALLFPQNASGSLLSTYNVVLPIELAVLYSTVSSRSGVTLNLGLLVHAAGMSPIHPQADSSWDLDGQY